MTDELKKCPFCNGKASVLYVTTNFGGLAYVECETCAAKTRTFLLRDIDDTNDIGYLRAADAWNRRGDDL